MANTMAATTLGNRAISNQPKCREIKFHLDAFALRKPKNPKNPKKKRQKRPEKPFFAFNP